MSLYYACYYFGHSDLIGLEQAPTSIIEFSFGHLVQKYKLF